MSDYYSPEAVRSRAEKALATAARRHAEQAEIVHFSERGLELANMIGDHERKLNARATLDAQKSELDIRKRVLSLATSALQRLTPPPDFAGGQAESAAHPLALHNKKLIHLHPPTQEEKPMSNETQNAIDAAVNAVLESSMTPEEVEASATMTTEQRAKFLALRSSKRHQTGGAK